MQPYIDDYEQLMDLFATEKKCSTSVVGGINGWETLNTRHAKSANSHFLLATGYAGL